MTTAARPTATRASRSTTRVADLLGRMTLDEKIAQLSSVWAFEVVEPGRARPRTGSRRWRGDGIGQITRLAVPRTCAPRRWPSWPT